MIGHFIAVGVGGAVGAMLRYGVSLASLRLSATDYPWGTLAVNVGGGLLMGLLVGMFASRGSTDMPWLLLGVGVLGGFTTFSAFSNEVVAMLERGAPGLAAGYILLSVTASIVALFIGKTLA